MESGSVFQQNSQHKLIQRETNPWNIWFQLIIWFLQCCSTWRSCFHYLGRWKVIQIYFKRRGVRCSLPVMESMLGMIEESVKTSGSSVCREGKTCSISSLALPWKEFSELLWCSLPLSSRDRPSPACCGHAVGLLEANRNIFLSNKSGL